MWVPNFAVIRMQSKIFFPFLSSWRGFIHFVVPPLPIWESWVLSQSFLKTSDYDCACRPIHAPRKLSWKFFVRSFCALLSFEWSQVGPVTPTLVKLAIEGPFLSPWTTDKIIALWHKLFRFASKWVATQQKKVFSSKARFFFKGW